MTQALKEQNHLVFKDKINLGAFYTPDEYIDIVWKYIEPFIGSDSVILDSSCGYGNFFENNIKCTKIGNDIDSIAYDVSKQNWDNTEIFNKNALLNVDRKTFNIDKDKKLIIIGNPPYNDTTSIMRSGIKNQNIEIDDDIKTRDYGISFLLSYAKLKADIICVLHPLSYLIKKTNFNLLKNLSKKYKLIDGLIIDSATFKETKGVSFPIIISLYQKSKMNMDFTYINSFSFKTINDQQFVLNNFDYISNYIKKYPTKNTINKDDDILFWTMRDINALKRNKTFVKKYSYNTIILDKAKLDYYVYVDVFKQFSKCIPYYFGNLEVFIDNELFIKNKHFFINEFLYRNSTFKQYYLNIEIIDNIKNVRQKIVSYFKSLLKEHYVY